jgi:dTMP kinase
VPRLPGRLITFEGTEGAGKSTLIRELASQLSASNWDVVMTREPGGSSVAESIRSLILDQAMDPWTELFLYEAARTEHLAATVLPALQAGKLVLCDRFTDSTLAYQGEARGLPWKEIEKLNHVATRGIVPSLTIWLDIDPAVGLDRANDRNRFEAEGVEFQKRVRKGFAKARASKPDRWLKIQARSGTPEQLAARCLKEITRRLGRSAPGGKNSTKRGSGRG